MEQMVHTSKTKQVRSTKSPGKSHGKKSSLPHNSKVAKSIKNNLARTNVVVRRKGLAKTRKFFIPEPAEIAHFDRLLREWMHPKPDLEGHRITTCEMVIVEFGGLAYRVPKEAAVGCGVVQVRLFEKRGKYGYVSHVKDELGQSIPRWKRADVFQIDSDMANSLSNYIDQWSEGRRRFGLDTFEIEPSHMVCGL
jgi:hypothetical protein